MKNNFFSFAVLGLIICSFNLAMPLAFAQITSTRLEPTSFSQTSPDSITDSAPSTSVKPVDSAKELNIKPLLIDKEGITKIEAIKKKDPPKADESKPIDWGILIQNLFSEYWVQFIALVVSVIGVVLAISGFSLANKKKHRYLKKFLYEIDNAYSSYKMKSKRCEAEMIRLQDQIEDKLKEGNLDESTYHLLEKRIEKYLQEIKTENGGKSAL